jgi:hypothetical protein
LSGVVEKSSFKSFARKGEKKVRKSSPQKVIVSFGVFDSAGLLHCLRMVRVWMRLFY